MKKQKCKLIKEDHSSNNKPIINYRYKTNKFKVFS